VKDSFHGRRWKRRNKERLEDARERVKKMEEGRVSPGHKVRK